MAKITLPLHSSLINYVTGYDKNCLILDSFAGSGTTAHAVLKLNHQDNGNRNFITIEMDDSVANHVTIKRIKSVVEGYYNKSGEYVSGLGGGFQFLTLSQEPLFYSDGPIRSDVNFEQLAEFVWFMETGTGLSSSNMNIKEKHTTPYLGKYKDRAIFLLYNGILKDKTDIGGNVLNNRSLEELEAALPNFSGPKVVYGARSRFDKTKLAKLGITFHQLPYELAVKTWF
ncbi:DNA methyltransferase [Pseudoalteromonas ulvae]|uniref:DNA methyltransferase n=1 Tax=Pseudoalteromonas ulvae TaxID=107327 RepID=UPI001C3CCD37|nr:DNA methyltransferase [Pseudoalteromonas ulvae]